MKINKKHGITSLTLFFILVLLPFFSNNTFPESVYSTINKKGNDKIISRIILNGHRRTKDKIILLYMDIDTGEVYDSLAVIKAENSLKESNLFFDVKIHPVTIKDSVTLMVFLKEKAYFKINSIGGELYSRKCGKKDNWAKAYLGISYSNLRGYNENLSVYTSIGPALTLGVSWYKPFIVNPLFIKLGSKIGKYPLIVDQWYIRLFNTSYIIFGSKIGDNSKTYMLLMEKYKKYEWKGGNGVLYKNDTIINSLPDSLSTQSQKLDSSWVLTTPEGNVYEWKANSSRKIKHYEKPFSEVFLTLGWVTDRRNNNFDPGKGFFLSLNSNTNALYPYKNYNGKKQIYIQLNCDFRLFHRGIWKNNTVAYRIQPTFKLLGQGNIYSGLYMGGSEYNLRGFSTGAFGGIYYNNRLLFSSEYRFHIWTTPEIRIPWLAWYDKNLSSFCYRFDGAVILDCGYIWKNFTNLIHPPSDNNGGIGTGLGIRLVFPSLKRSVSFDVVWKIYNKANKIKTWPLPHWYFYLDLPF